MAEKSYRVRTNVNEDKVVTVKLDQDFDFLEILSLRIGQKGNYKTQASNYGVIVGRVLANDSFGVPNCKVSVFIPISDSDVNQKNLREIYPYSTTFSVNRDNIRYNLLPNSHDDECVKSVGSFPTKREVLDNDFQIEIFDKYWKYTTVTNSSGDYMIYGVPTGSTQVHIDLDLSDIGILSQRPIDMIYKGYDINEFDSPSQFKDSTNLGNLVQILTQNKTVYVYPFWGDESANVVAISRCDVNVDYKFEPTCIFMGSIVSNSKQSFNHKCSSNSKSDTNDEMVTGEGTIEMIRKTVDGYVEEFSIEDNKLIDDNGTWCYQIPMNLDYIGTDEFGNIIKTDNPNKGIPTKTSVRFRITYNETNSNTKHRARYLVPNNPDLITNKTSGGVQIEDPSSFDKLFNFGSSTPNDCFRDLHWNNVYSVKNYIPRLQRAILKITKKYSAIKDTNLTTDNNPFPFNNLRMRLPFMYRLLCSINTMYVNLISVLNASVLSLIGSIPVIGKKVGCIGYSFLDVSEGETPVAYYPGCWSKAALRHSKCPDDLNSCIKNKNKNTLIDAIEIALADEFEVAHLDFYNDWVNGVLYYPLWFWKKTKKQKYLFGLFSIKAKNTFCDCEKTYKRFRLTESCALPIKYIRDIASKGLQLKSRDKSRTWDKDFYKKKIGRGIIKEYTNKDGLKVYYYTPGVVLSNNYKNVKSPRDYARLYSTDIILLGSISNVSLDNLPKLFINLPPTTSNLPQIETTVEEMTQETIIETDTNDTLSDLQAELDGFDDKDDDDNGIDDNNAVGKVETSGMSWGRKGSSEGFKRGLFFDLTCNSYYTRLKTCVNVERLSELGMTLDSSVYVFSSDGNEVVSSEFEADGLLTRHEITDLESRAMFASMNGVKLIDSVKSHDTDYLTYKLNYNYSIDLDGKLSSLAPTYTASNEVRSYDNFDKDYIRFRLGETPKYYSDSFLLYDNSFYFYFGLQGGSTAIDRLMSDFYSECSPKLEKGFGLDIEYESGDYCPLTVKDYPLLSINVGNIKKPYSYKILDEWGEVLIEEDDMNLSTLYIGAEPSIDGYVQFEKNGEVAKNGRLWYQNPASYDEEEFNMDFCFLTYETEGIDENVDNYIYFENGKYTIEVTDAKGIKVTETVNIEQPQLNPNIRVIGLGTKYYGYAEMTSEGDNEEEELEVIGDYELGDDTEYSSNDSNDTNYDEEDEEEIGNEEIEEDNKEDDSSLLNDYSEIVINNESEGETSQSVIVSEKKEKHIDEKSFIMSSNKEGCIIIESIEIDNKEYIPYEIYYRTDNLTAVKLNHQLYDENGVAKVDEHGKNITTEIIYDISEFEKNKFLLILFNPDDLSKRVVSVRIDATKYNPFVNCSCDYDENNESYSGLIYKVSDGKVINSALNPSTSQEVSADIIKNIRSYIKFNVWKPDSYVLSIYQYCYENGKTNAVRVDNKSITTNIVQNGEPFELRLNDIPLKFLLGSSNNESDYNKKFFYYTNENGGGNNAAHPGQMQGWFGLHLPSTYYFPSVNDDGYERWSEYLKLSKDEDDKITSASKANVIMYKFNTLFKLSNTCYITSETNPYLNVTSIGGIAPILYIDAYPNYNDDTDLTSYVVDTYGSLDALIDYPNIVGSNYTYKIANKSNSKPKKKSTSNNLYNGLNLTYKKAAKAFFNPNYMSNHNTNSYIDLTDKIKTDEYKQHGNYFAGFTLNGGLEKQDGKCVLVKEYSARTESYPVLASKYTTCPGTESIIPSKDLSSGITKHYFRAETVDRRLDYDMFMFMPSYSSPGIKIIKGKDANGYDYLVDSMNYGRFYCTVYNGIEMSYEKTINPESSKPYNIIGKKSENGLEYYYNTNDASILTNINSSITSKNRRFYSSTLICGNKKFDINDMYYSKNRSPENVVSLANFTNVNKLSKYMDGDNNFNALFSLALDNLTNSPCYYLNEITSDFSYDEYPMKRTCNIAAIPNVSKVSFNVTSCSYEMESGLNEYVSQDASSEEDFTITAETIAGESCEVTIDTRDKIVLAHSYSESDLETTYDNFEIKYSTLKVNSNTINKIKFVQPLSIDSNLNTTLIAYFMKDSNMRLRFRGIEDTYCSTHDTFTSRPMLMNIMNTELYTLGKDNNGDGRKNQKICFGGDKNYLNEALSNSVSPNDITSQIKTNCRCQFIDIDSKPSSVKTSYNVDLPYASPYNGKFSKCCISQLNYNKYPLLVDSENQYTDLVYDDNENAKNVLYRYGIYGYRSEGKNGKNASDWGDYFKYGGGFLKKKKKYYYHYNVASVCGVVYERSYVNREDDKLGKNIKLLKLTNILDLRPLMITFGGPTLEFDYKFTITAIGDVLGINWYDVTNEFFIQQRLLYVLHGVGLYTNDSVNWDEINISAYQNNTSLISELSSVTDIGGVIKSVLENVKTDEEAERIKNTFNRYYFQSDSSNSTHAEIDWEKSEKKKDEMDAKDYGGSGGAVFYIYTSSIDSLFSPYHKWFSLFDEDIARQDDGTYDYSLKACNVEWVGFCINKEPKFVGSKITLSTNVDSETKIPYLIVDVKWPTEKQETEASEDEDEDDEEENEGGNTADEINDYFGSKGKKGTTVALILRTKSGYYYTIPFKMGYYKKRRKYKNVFGGVE